MRIAALLLASVALSAPVLADAQGVRYFNGASVTPPPSGPFMQAATSNYVPFGVTAAGSTSMTRKAHIARDNISTIKVGLPGWYVNAGLADTNLAWTAKVWIEYPSGTYTPVTASSSSTISIPAGQTLISDAIALPVTIPSSATFWEWDSCLGQCPATASYSGFLHSAAGEGSITGTTGIPTAPSGSAPGNTAQQFGSSVVLLAQTTTKSVFIPGDSRNFGVNDSTPDAVLDRGSIARSLGPSLAYLNAGVPADTTVAYLGSANRFALAQYFTHVVSEYATNDMYLNVGTCAGTQAYKLREANRYNGKPYLRTTIEPQTTSTDAWVTPTGPPYTGTNNQTITTADTAFTCWNDYVRAAVDGPSYMEVSDAVSTARDSGYWIGGYTNSAGSGLHADTTGSAAVVTYGGVSASTVLAQANDAITFTPVATANSAVFSTTAPKFGSGNLSGGNLATYGIGPSVAPYTIEIWVKGTSTATNTLFGAAGGDSITMTAAGTPNAGINGAGLIGTISTTDGNWHFMGLYAGLTSQHFCVDGALSASGSTNASVVKGTTSAIAIGGLGRPTTAGTTAVYAGQYDEFADFNYDKWAVGSACPAPPTAPYTGTETGLIVVNHLDGASVFITGPAF